MFVVNISFGWLRYSFHDVKRFNPDLVSIATGVLLELMHYNALSNSAQKFRLHYRIKYRIELSGFCCAWYAMYRFQI